MKKVVIGLFLSVLLFGAGVCFAGPAVPNLVGTWTVKTEGVVMFKGGDPVTGSMHGGEATALDANGKIKHVSRQGEVVVTAQQGRILHGTFTSSKVTEKFVGVIGWDNKTVYIADEDGFMNGNIVGKNKVNVIYEHSSPSDTVVLAVSWVRKK